MDYLPTSLPANFTTFSIYGDQYDDQYDDQDTPCLGVEHTEKQLTLVTIYILLISALGIVLNLFVLIVFCFHKKACTVAEIYLSNLAAADFILSSCVPFWAVYVYNGFNWPFADALCPLVTLSINMNAYSSIYFLVLISIDRYLALVHTMSHGRMRSPKYAKLGCLLVWCFGLLLSVPTFVFRKVGTVPLGQTTVKACHLDYPENTELLFIGMLTTFGFIIPISIIFYCTLKVIHSLRNHLMKGLNHQKVEQRATTLVLAVLSAFIICWVPFHVIRILGSLLNADILSGCHTATIIIMCKHIFMYLAFFNSALNPILYIIVGKNFRKKVRELFQQRQRIHRTTLNTTPTGSTMLNVETVSV